MFRRDRVLRAVLATGFCLLLTACAAPRPDGGGAAGDAAGKVWPPAPAAARIRFVRSISAPHDAGVRRSFLRRLADRLGGRPEVHFVRPTGVAAGGGVVYVADPGANTLWVLDPGGKRSSAIDKIGSTRLVSPVAVAARPDGAVYVADSVLGKVLLLDRKGDTSGVVVGSGLKRPAALAYDAAEQHLYVADSAAQRILVYKADGEALFSWGERGSGAGQFNYPTYLALDNRGELLVTDALNFRVQAFDRDGKFLWQFGRHGDTSGSFAAPKGVAVDSDRHVYVVDTLFDVVQLFASDGTYLMSFGGRGSEVGQFWLPGGLFIDDRDRIYVADAYNRRVQVFEFLHSAPQSPAQKP